MFRIASFLRSRMRFLICKGGQPGARRAECAALARPVVVGRPLQWADLTRTPTQDTVVQAASEATQQTPRAAAASQVSCPRALTATCCAAPTETCACLRLRPSDGMPRPRRRASTQFAICNVTFKHNTNINLTKCFLLLSCTHRPPPSDLRASTVRSFIGCASCRS